MIQSFNDILKAVCVSEDSPPFKFLHCRLYELNMLVAELLEFIIKLRLNASVRRQDLRWCVHLKFVRYDAAPLRLDLCYGRFDFNGTDLKEGEPELK